MFPSDKHNTAPLLFPLPPVHDYVPPDLLGVNTHTALSEQADWHVPVHLVGLRQYEYRNPILHSLSVLNPRMGSLPHGPTPCCFPRARNFFWFVSIDCAAQATAHKLDKGLVTMRLFPLSQSVYHVVGTRKIVEMGTTTLSSIKNAFTRLPSSAEMK